MNLRYLFYTLIFVILFKFYGCEIKEPTAPRWDIDLNLPLTNKSYNIFDILKRSSNVGFDSLNNNEVFLYGESSYRRKFDDDIKFDGITTTNLTSPSTLELDTSIVIDDSTYILKADFLNGILNFTFYNVSNTEYTVNATIENLFSVQNGDTARVIKRVLSGQTASEDLNLQNYYIKNGLPDNSLRLKIKFQSQNPVPVNFDYKLSSYSVKSFEGRLKPIRTGITSDVVDDPFGTDVPEGEVNFARISSDKNFIVLKKYDSLYRVDFSDISIVGENKNKNRVRFKYLKYGNPGDPIDSVFSLILPSNRDSIAYPINENNSNIREFINNIPKKIISRRMDILNSTYQEGVVNNTDSLLLKFIIQVPLDFSITQPVVFYDTVNTGISDESQRKALDDAKTVQLTIDAVNGFPLKTISRILVLDSFFTPLISISQIVGNQPDSTISVASASIGSNGYVSNFQTTRFTAELDSSQIDKIKRMGKIIYEYKLYTDPNLIPPPLTTVKIRGTDLFKTISFGTIKYRINL